MSKESGSAFASNLFIGLSRAKIDRALAALARPLTQYEWLQSNARKTDVSKDRNFQRRFNHFYRVRRNARWQQSFYSMFERSKKRRTSFSDVLKGIHETTGRWEASFASKLIATIDSRQPVIDSIVLRNVGARLPASPNRRLEAMVALHGTLGARLREFLATQDGQYVVRRFRKMYPGSRVSRIKMVDLVLWQAR